MKKTKQYKPLLATLLLYGLSYHAMAEENTLREIATLVQEQDTA